MKAMAYRELHLLPSAPPEVRRAAYRALAMLHHPDKGGDVETMKRINAAWECLGVEVRR
jgi:DnaJ homolog subfamily A member 2